MLQDKPNGMGTVRFWARPWSKDAADCQMEVSISSDHGSTWEKVGEVTVKANGGADNVYAEYTLTVNRAGALRLKVEQTGGARCMLDDLSVSDCSTSGIQLTPGGHAYHSWDAYCLNGQLVIENSDPGNFFSVYSLDGREVFAGNVTPGSISIPLPAGLYIVNVKDFSRRVLVK